jgi:Zn-dependent M16 (insulinase) family peptidase
MIQNGFSVAVTRLESYLTRRGIFNETIHGMNYYWFITGLVKKFDENPSAVISKLKQTQELLFRKNNLVAGTTCSNDDFKKVCMYLEPFVGKLPDPHGVHSAWNPVPVSLNEGILTSSGVQYVVKGYDFRQLGFSWDGKWHVLSHILSTDWLHSRIRVMGGAYGGFSSVSKNGIIFLASYRDPNLRETLENFDATGAYLTGFRADDPSMTRYIIGTIAGLDSPLTPSEKGEMAFRYHFEKTGHNELKADRQAVLTTTAGDIRTMSAMISKVLEKNVFCTYGNEVKLKDNRDIFGQLVMLQQ